MRLGILAVLAIAVSGCALHLGTTNNYLAHDSHDDIVETVSEHDAG